MHYLGCGLLSVSSKPDSGYIREEYLFEHTDCTMPSRFSSATRPQTGRGPDSKHNSLRWL